MDLLKGLQIYGNFKLRWSGSPNFQRPLAAKLCIGSPKVFEVQERARGPLITVPSLTGLGFHLPPGWPKTLSFLSVCLFVCLFATLLNVEGRTPCFAKPSPNQWHQNRSVRFCGSIVNIESATAEIRRGKQEETTGRKHNVRSCYTGRP